MAKKINKDTIIKFLPLIILLAGLIIMTVCFFINGGKLQDANACNADLNTKIEALNADVAAKQAELDAKLAEIDELTAKLADNSELDTAKAELDAANEKIATLEAAIGDYEAKVDNILAMFGVEISTDDAPEAETEAPAAE